MAIKCIVAGINISVGKPIKQRCIRAVERNTRGLSPVNSFCGLHPKSFWVRFPALINIRIFHITPFFVWRVAPTIAPNAMIVKPSSWAIFVISGEFSVFLRSWCFSNILKIDLASFACIKYLISRLEQVFIFVSLQQISIFSCSSTDMEFVDGRQFFDRGLLKIGFWHHQCRLAFDLKGQIRFFED